VNLKHNDENTSMMVHVMVNMSYDEIVMHMDVKHQHDIFDELVYNNVSEPGSLNEH